MTHIENIPHILDKGIVHATSVNASPDFKPIGDIGLIQTRQAFKLDNGRLLGEYIPFYFGVKMPMLYVIQRGFNMVKATPAEDIVYCVTTVQEIWDRQLEVVFTDGHAVDKFTKQYNASHLPILDTLLDWEAIKAKYWKTETDLDLKRRKEAEFLVGNDVHKTALRGFVVASEAAKNKLEGWGVPNDKVVVKQNYYF